MQTTGSTKTMKYAGLGLAALLMAGAACTKDAPEPAWPGPAEVEPPEPGAADDSQADAERAAAEAAAREAEAKAEAEAEEKRKQEERVTEALARIEETAAKEGERWTPALTRKAVALRNRKFGNPRQALAAILKSDHRVPGNSDRDRYRRPVETLTFLGIRPNMTVVEFGAGAGWYTEILAPLLWRQGKLVVVGYDPEGPADSMLTAYGRRLSLFLAKSAELFGKVEVVHVSPPDSIDLGLNGTADLVIAFREMHGWHRRGGVEPYLAAVHRALKDGGTFGVVQHRAPEGADPDESAPRGYLPEAWVIEKVEAAGFRLSEKSEVNANAKDTKDYPHGVWNLPPALRDGDQDRDKYVAIGESDRMTLSFVKVASED